MTAAALAGKRERVFEAAKTGQKVECTIARPRLRFSYEQNCATVVSIFLPYVWRAAEMWKSRWSMPARRLNVVDLAGSERATAPEIRIGQIAATLC